VRCIICGHEPTLNCDCYYCMQAYTKKRMGETDEEIVEEIAWRITTTQ